MMRKMLQSGLREVSRVQTRQVLLRDSRLMNLRLASESEEELLFLDGSGC